jgi:molecular chaperone HtpG
MAKTTQSFNAEIKQLLDIVIHSLYSQKEIFVRELISNASDALDKLKFETLTKPDLVSFDHKFEIRLDVPKDQKVLKIIDTGIGMSPDEVTQFIGTIAKSGTKNFTQMNAELKNRPELIGQFGVGFYSAFMVAERVTLHTQKAGTNVGTLWESSGDGSYSIDEVPRAEGVGTTITLFLKPAAEGDDEFQDFSDFYVLRGLVKKYSDFVSWPIWMKSLRENVEKDEIINSQKALWLRPASEISPEEYKEFYRHVSHDFMDPLKWTHYKAEGTLEFTVLFYIPSKKPWNYQSKDHEFGLNLYVKKIFIMENCQELLPPYLRFIRGLVDSSDLSLNVSREMLQQDRQVTQIRKNVVSRVLGSLRDMLTKDREQYLGFFKEFGNTLKEGIPMDAAQREKISELLLFQSTQIDGMITLSEYVEKMKESQKDIYYITGDRLESLKNSPYLEKLNAKGYPVLLLTDAVDEWVVQDMPEFKGKKLVSITKEGLDLDTEEEKKQKEEDKKASLERFGSLLEKMKKFLESDVKDVVISDRLTETPVCLVSGAHDMTAHMERILSQMEPQRGGSKRILEINPKHPILETMLGLNEEQQKNWSEILYNQALLTEGSQLPDPVKFTKLVASLMVR